MLGENPVLTIFGLMDDTVVFPSGGKRGCGSTLGDDPLLTTLGLIGDMVVVSMLRNSWTYDGDDY